MQAIQQRRWCPSRDEGPQPEIWSSDSDAARAYLKRNEFLGVTVTHLSSIEFVLAFLEHHGGATWYFDYFFFAAVALQLFLLGGH